MATGARAAASVGDELDGGVLKAFMAVSGLVMVLWLLAHTYGNLKAFSGQAAFDGYADHLRTIGEPFLPHAGALWIVRWFSWPRCRSTFVRLWGRGTGARAATAGRGGWPNESSRARRGVQRTYASFTMRWGGVVIALFVD